MDSMRELIAKYPDGFEGWAKEHNVPLDAGDPAKLEGQRLDTKVEHSLALMEGGAGPFESESMQGRQIMV